MEKISRSSIAVGEELKQDVYLKNGMLLLSRGHYVLTPVQKERLIQMGMWASDDDKKQAAQFVPSAKVEERKLNNPLIEVDALFRRAKYILNHYYNIPDFTLEIEFLVNRIMTMCKTMPDGSMASCLLVPFDDYGSAHAVHTSIMIYLLGKKINLNEEELKILVSAALTMNIGSCSLHTALYKQSTPLTIEQKNEMDAHPLLASALLRDLGVDNEIWHTIVQQHHEEYDGGGYPNHLTKEEIHPSAHLLHLVDVLMSILVQSARRDAYIPSIALAKLYKKHFQTFDDTFVALLIKELGIYPPGSFVCLENGEIAVVVKRQRSGQTQHPEVAALRSQSGEMYTHPIIRHTKHPDFSIKHAISIKDAHIRPSFLINLWSQHPPILG